MADLLTPTISDRICKHMNEDHSDAIILYAKAYGNQPETESAQMLSIDIQGMDLSIKIQDKVDTIRIEFDHDLIDSEDAHQTLISMIGKAKANLVN